MEILTRLNKIMEYIDDHLQDEIDRKHIARLACSSESQFNRLFAIIADQSIGEYIRNRRLTKAAFDIQYTNEKIIDIALNYGYESPEAFCRAFHKIHGVSPSQARKEGVSLKAYPKLTFQISIKGVVPMDYRIVSMEGFKVYGKEGVFTCENGENLKKLPQFWENSFKDGSLQALIDSDVVEEENGLCSVMGICDYSPLEGSEFYYMLGRKVTPTSQVNDYKVVDIPAATWAVFKTKEHEQDETSKEIQDVIKRIYTDWLPSASYEKVNGYELELYYRNPKTGKDYSESWIRVVPK